MYTTLELQWRPFLEQLPFKTKLMKDILLEMNKEQLSAWFEIAMNIRREYDRPIAGNRLNPITIMHYIVTGKKVSMPGCQSCSNQFIGRINDLSPLLNIANTRLKEFTRLEQALQNNELCKCGKSLTECTCAKGIASEDCDGIFVYNDIKLSDILDCNETHWPTDETLVTPIPQSDLLIDIMDMKLSDMGFDEPVTKKTRKKKNG